MLHVSLVRDRNPIADSRAGNAYIGGTPAVFFDAGHTASVGGFAWSDVVNNGASLVPYYVPEIEAAGVRAVPPLELLTAIDWIDDENVFVHVAIANGVAANTAPSMATTPTGLDRFPAGESHAFETSATDPDGNRVYYMWDWGDGEQSDWIGPYVEGTTVSATHSWTVDNNYEIKVKSKDPFGEETDWSAPLAITINCCEGKVGDANLLGTDVPTIGDVSVMIDAKFIAGICNGILDCLPEADINQSGGMNPTCNDITIGDISILIDYLFITGPSLGLNDCM
jgi:hypothetical protein